MENFGYLVLAAIVLHFLFKAWKEWEDDQIRKELGRSDELQRRIDREHRLATPVVARCPDCGHSWTANIPCSTFYVSCPKCNARTYAGP